MCVIAVSPVGVNAPTEENMKDMFTYNDDGAGFAYTLNKRVYIEKGFLKYTDFARAVSYLEKRLKKRELTLKDIPVMFHFRIGTHGPNSPALTHPFPISDNPKHLGALDLYANTVMAHNGIIHSVTPKAGVSDTQQYIADILVPLAKHDVKFYESKAIQELMKNTINGSRFVFLNQYGDFNLIGSWDESVDKDLEGIKYSNLNHEAYSGYTSYYSNGRYGGWSGDYYADDSKSYVSVYMAKMPEDTIVANGQELDAQFKPIEDILTTLKDSTQVYYVDDLGDIYVEGLNGAVHPSAIYDYAVKQDETTGLWSFLTAEDMPGPLVTKITRIPYGRF